jgi:hypothetical protein
MNRTRCFSNDGIVSVKWDKNLLWGTNPENLRLPQTRDSFSKTNGIESAALAERQGKEGVPWRFVFCMGAVKMILGKQLAFSALRFFEPIVG